MFDKLNKIKDRFDEINALISDPGIISNQQEWKKLVKERAQIEDTVVAYEKYISKQKEESDLEALIKTEKDKELLDLAKKELYDIKKELENSVEELKILLLPKDPKDDSNVIIEIRSCAGGSEAALFGYELMKMYMKYAEKNRWTVEEIDVNLTELGGIKEATFMISGNGVYAKLKHESGVHRVQRVPETESQGRVHTSTVSVAVLPEVEDIEVDIKESDLRVDTYRSSGAGGQHVNTTDSAIRITHLPTGIVVTCQDERNQHKNREKAMKVLKSKIYDYYNTIAEKEYKQTRKMQIGTGDRSERIRTYNFPQGRVTDHRISLTLYSLNLFMMGEMDEMIEGLRLAYEAARLKEANL
ncbi:MAG: peptide chain release factor 1 [Christensenellales bacterium]|jgi:peptide chain release factor 1